MTEYLVTIDPDGNVSIDAQDGQGSSCKDDVKDLLKKLGTVEDEGRKPEYYQANSEQIGVGRK